MQLSRIYLCLTAAAILLALSPARQRAAEQPKPAESSTTEFASKVRPLLRKHCYGCHEGANAKGKFRLDELAPALTDDSVAAWKEVKERLAKHVMPPPKSPQPSAEESKTIIGWIDGKLTDREATEQKAQGRVVMRRLNRTEYENTLSDLLGLPLEVKEMLPEDTSAEGFDNVGSALRISSVQMQRYLEAADTALGHFFAGGQPAPKSIKQKYFYTQEQIAKDRVAKGEPKNLRVTDDALILFNGNPGDYAPYELRQFFCRTPGLYRFRISTYAVQSPDRPITMAVYAGKLLAGYFDVPGGKPTVIEFTTPLKRNQTVKPVPYRLGYNPMPVPEDKRRGLALQWVEVEGPLLESWPPREYGRLLGNVDLKKGTIDDAERILRDFASRAFRRPVNNSKLEPFLDVLQQTMRESKQDGFENGLRTGMAAILCSPHFLFLVEKPGKLNDYALAARLSYFLWSTMPDEELTRLASEGGIFDLPRFQRPLPERQTNEANLRPGLGGPPREQLCGHRATQSILAGFERR